MTYKQLLLQLVIVCLLCANTSALAEQKAQTWPDWQRFKRIMISEDGRVIDYSTKNAYTTSEGQSYGMFFALVNNEPKIFEKLYRWTQNNLANGNLKTNLPAWQWGNNDGKWQIIDRNSASDSDLWIAYALLEAGRLWQNQHYREVGLALGNLILTKETADIPQMGLTLLPAPKGFTPTKTSWKLNPSYVPIQLLRAMLHHSKDPKWQALIQSSQQLIIDSSPQGFSPDWIIYQQNKGFDLKPEIGSYNAIRVYLWAGMLADQDPLKEPQLRQLNPMAIYLTQHFLPPEQVNHLNGKTSGNGPIGFSAALLPFLAASDAHKALSNQLIRLINQPLSTEPKRYYDQVLGLFGVGWIQQRYRFDHNGLVKVPWSES